mmetsp:Transcript_36769/g.102725  ORF Transcript_36769/g.102725 Transcript_36769/m.102725 type:complete len:97 (-) Transcript_36769:713-1003(-)
MMMGMPLFIRVASIAFVVASSRALMLSSSNSTFGRRERAIAREMRCASPPDKVDHSWWKRRSSTPHPWAICSGDCSKKVASELFFSCCRLNCRTSL